MISALSSCSYCSVSVQGAQQYIRKREEYGRCKKVYSLGYGNKTDVRVRATNSSWTITPVTTVCCVS